MIKCSMFPWFWIHGEITFNIFIDLNDYIEQIEQIKN